MLGDLIKTKKPNIPTEPPTSRATSKATSKARPTIKPSDAGEAKNAFTAEVKSESFTAKVTTLTRDRSKRRFTVNYAAAKDNAFTAVKAQGKLKYPPAVRYELDALLYGRVDDTALNERQKRWRKNVVTSTSIREKTDDVVSSKNPLGNKRYVWFNAVAASKNGMLYYLAPMLLDVIFLIMNVAKYAFFENILVALVSLLAYKIVLAVIKNRERGAAVKSLVVGAVVAAYLGGLYALYRFVPSFWQKLHFGFTLKLFFMVFCLSHFLTFYALFALSYAQDVAKATDNSCVVECKAGDPGCGKTSQAVEDVFVMGLMKWRELQLDYWSWHSREKEILKRNDKNELLEYHEIKASYNYYIMRACIPCVWSNICLTDSKGRTCSKVTLDHIRGIERLPLYSVVLFDEIGAVLKCELSNKKIEYYDVSDMFRLGRHFLKWAVVCCEQDFNNIYIDCRRVVGRNVIISYQEWVCKPTVALWLYDFLKVAITDTLDKKVGRNAIAAVLMAKLKKFVYSIGFRKQVFKYARNTETGSEKKAVKEKELKLSDAKVRYIPSKVICGYDDRAYRTNYASYYDKEIHGELFDRAGADMAYNRQFVGETSLLNEKRTATDADIRKVG